MREALSFGLFVCLMIPVAGMLFIVARNELEGKQRVTGGLGMLTVFGFIIVFFVMPVFAYFVRF